MLSNFNSRVDWSHLDAMFKGLSPSVREKAFRQGFRAAAMLLKNKVESRLSAKPYPQVSRRALLNTGIRPVVWDKGSGMGISIATTTKRTRRGMEQFGMYPARRSGYTDRIPLLLFAEFGRRRGRKGKIAPQTYVAETEQAERRNVTDYVQMFVSEYVKRLAVTNGAIFNN